MKYFLLSIFISLIGSVESQITFRLKPDGEKSQDAIATDLPSAYTTNYADVPLFMVAAWTVNGVFEIVHGFIDFDWSTLPPNSTISSAKLTLFAFNGEAGIQEFHSTTSGPNDSWIERITTPWNEGTVSFASHPQSTQLNRVSIPASDSINQDFEIDVTQLANDILQNPGQGFGFLMKLQNENYFRRLGFCSSDNGDPSKWPEITITFEAPGVTGTVFDDFNGNCLQEIDEFGLANRLIEIKPGNYLAQTNESGIWNIMLPPGDYTATLINNSGNWSNSCDMTTDFTVVDSTSSLVVPGFGLQSSQTCTSPNISIYSNILRRCFSEQEIYVQASNSFLATASIDDAHAEITLDPLFTLDSATLAYTSLGNNTFSFALDTLDPSESVTFTLYVTLSCEARLLETLCFEAALFPVDPCSLDTVPNPFPPTVSPCNLPWDHSSLSVNGWCQNDTVYFTITNNGQFGDGDMDCYAPVRIYIDGVLTTVDSIRLVGGETITYTFAGTGQTWILEADQHPLHPGNSHPNAHVELCGDPTNWTPDIINDFPTDDADPAVDIFCTVTNGSYDPNDKKASPGGVLSQNYILPNQDLEYSIRFQNTGTDTAFTVVVRDTLDDNLDITSVMTTVSSHPYSFRIYGTRVLEWRFDDILLVDSTKNEPKSHGFVQFSVKQLPDLPNGTILNNEADIYFDYNVPVITNNVFHEIDDHLGNYPKSTPFPVTSIYPNPAENELYVASNTDLMNLTYQMTDLTGKVVLKGEFDQQYLNKLSLNKLLTGLYIISFDENGEKREFKVIKK